MSLQPCHFGLIGYPLGHSLSPKIHSAALRACGLEGDYSLFPIHPGDMPGLKKLLARMRAGEIHGLNVTIPHKQSVIHLLDELTPTARAIGAVNTVYMKGKKLIGHNTDAEGFITDLKRIIDSSSFRLSPSSLILGAGGSARAVVYALLNDHWQVAVAARRIEQARQLTDWFKDFKLRITDYTLPNVSGVALIVNATPIGMSPKVDESPWPDGLSLPTDAIIYDLVYNPSETKLAKGARAAGLRAVTGLGMLIEQAALTFEIWTGHSPSRALLHEALA